MTEVICDIIYSEKNRTNSRIWGVIPENIIISFDFVPRSVTICSQLLNYYWSQLNKQNCQSNRVCQMFHSLQLGFSQSAACSLHNFPCYYSPNQFMIHSYNVTIPSFVCLFYNRFLDCFLAFPAILCRYFIPTNDSIPSFLLWRISHIKITYSA